MGGKPHALARTQFGAAGFTLIETLITLIVVSVVGIALFQVLTVSKNNVEDQKSTLEAQQNARVGLAAIAEDFRHVSYGKDPSQPSIYYADEDSVVFVADIWDEPGAETISYYLSRDGDPDTPNPNDTVLMKSVRDSVGNVLVDSPQSYGIASSGLQMRYFTGDNNEIASPVAAPETIGEIRMLLSAVSPTPMQDGNYHTVTLSTTIYPRNLPLTPARARPNPPTPNGTGVPNCEAITVRWIAPTENTDGTPLPLDEISHFNFYLTQDSGPRALNARLNRTVTQRTVPGLEPGHIYTVDVTAVSRAGVESYPMTRVIDLTFGLFPEEPTGISAVVDGNDVTLSWDHVTTFDDGSTIDTPVFYRIYQSDDPNFSPDTDTFLAQTPEFLNTWVVNGLAECELTYFRITAVACTNESSASPAEEIVAPAPVSCPTNVAAIVGNDTGEIHVSWDTPTTRTDGSTLDPSALDHFIVYVDTTVTAGPGSPYDIVGPSINTHTVIVPGCDTYFVNVVAVDACGTDGDLCPYNEVTVTLGAPCDPGPPVAPTGLTQSSGESSLYLTWDANTVDCDLAGYRVWYGHNAGGPYNGNGAAEGSSPIMVDAESVTSGDVANFALTGLGACASYYVVVTAYDVCEPFEESGYSNEAFIDTSCQPCDLQVTCSPSYTSGSSDQIANIGIYSSGADEDVTQMKVGWAGGQLLSEVLVDGVAVWRADGTRGDDPAQSPVPSGTTITPDSFQISGSSTASNGHELELVFDSDFRGEDVFVNFVTSNGPCSISQRVEPSLVVDDFDDNNYSGWTVQTGNWSVTSGMLRQTNDAGVFQWMHTSVLSHGGDFIMEADMEVTVGGYGLLQFNRDAADSRYMVYLSTWANEGHIGRFTTAYTDYAFGPQVFNEGEFYKTKIVKAGDVYQLYVNCRLIAETSIYPEPPAGRFGFGAYYSKVRVDDVVITGNTAAGSPVTRY